ncbi:MAG TPA: ABC transporter ATP-binding protein [Lachnospiraceae bacterium]|uniref:ABC transporter ATP-binding protein n=1 Tax=Anaerosporobacter sp. TaxID=1872529 RepID=UPI000EE04820|nr:ABC transporter ATP-binding protein [Anaerosporobacter sp.]HAB60474.1 ABC transporter ATP-binding protein [Lachnospiraceae bacterium]
MKEAIIQAKDLCKSYANNGIQNHVLNHIDLDIYVGDFTVIMGSSGSGKSTLLYTLSGMDKVTSGEVWYKKEDITKKKEKGLSYLRRKDFGFVFQQIHLVSNLSLFENIAVPGYLVKEFTNKEVNERTDELLEQVGVEEFKRRLPSQTSGGQQQRACIARALISNPSLLFADEPTGALNKAAGNDVLDLLSSFNQQGQSILMVTHDVKAAIRATRLLYLEDGKIVGEMEMPPYSEENKKSKETMIVSFLTSRGW